METSHAVVCMLSLRLGEFNGLAGHLVESFCSVTGRDVLEDLLERDAEDVGDAEGYFERRGVLVAFDRDDGLTRDGDAVGELLLCHGTGSAELADGVAEGGLHADIR